MSTILPPGNPVIQNFLPPVGQQQTGQSLLPPVGENALNRRQISSTTAFGVTVASGYTWLRNSPHRRCRRSLRFRPVPRTCKLTVVKKALAQEIQGWRRISYPRPDSSRPCKISCLRPSSNKRKLTVVKAPAQEIQRRHRASLHSGWTAADGAKLLASGREFRLRRFNVGTEPPTLRLNSSQRCKISRLRPGLAQEVQRQRRTSFLRLNSSQRCKISCLRPGPACWRFNVGTKLPSSG